MARANGSAPPEAIRIEDEVWQEAFTRREPASDNRRRRLRAIEGGRGDWLDDQSDWLSAPLPDSASDTAPSAAPEAVTIVPASEPADTELPAATWLGNSSAHDTAPPSRRTVKIQGRGAERHLPLPDPARRRSSRRAYERAGFRPDRLAMWAVLLGFLLVFVAIASGHG